MPYAGDDTWEKKINGMVFGFQTKRKDSPQNGRKYLQMN